MSVKYKLIENTVKLYIWDGADVIIPLSRAKGTEIVLISPLAPTSEPDLLGLKMFVYLIMILFINKLFYINITLFVFIIVHKM